MIVSQQAKMFKRKNTSLRLLTCIQKGNEDFLNTNKQVKYLSPKNVIGLDNSFYKREQSLIKKLQAQIALLKRQVISLKQQNISLAEQNGILKNLIQQNSERQKTNQTYQSATENVLNQLKQKIQLLNQDDQLSTYDDIHIGDICNCESYERQIKCFQKNVKFLEDSLLHSEQIIIKIKKENSKLKESFMKVENKIREKILAEKVKFKSEKKFQKYKITAIKQSVQDGQE